MRKFISNPIAFLVIASVVARPVFAQSRSATSGRPALKGGADAGAIAEARRAQNRAIAAGNVDEVAAYWTEDVAIRRGLGTAVTGRDAYRQLFVSSGNRDSAVVYQREATDIEVSPKWPLAYETGTWVGHLGQASGPAVITGRYAAQWVKRQGRWLIRSEVFVALNCSGIGCQYVAVP